MNSNVIKLRDLSPKRDYIRIDDVTDALLASMDQQTQYGFYNIASGKSYSVQEMADLIVQTLGTSKEILNTQEVRVNEITDTKADISLAAEELKWHLKIDVGEGVSSWIQSIRCRS